LEYSDFLRRYRIPAIARLMERMMGTIVTTTMEVPGSCPIPFTQNHKQMRSRARIGRNIFKKRIR
jgi:hypothetical protein